METWEHVQEGQGKAEGAGPAQGLMRRVQRRAGLLRETGGDRTGGNSSG